MKADGKEPGKLFEIRNDARNDIDAKFEFLDFRPEVDAAEVLVARRRE
jgi:hypothetical protein